MPIESNAFGDQAAGRDPSFYVEIEILNVTTGLRTTSFVNHGKVRTGNDGVSFSFPQLPLPKIYSLCGTDKNHLFSLLAIHFVRSTTREQWSIV